MSGLLSTLFTALGGEVTPAPSVVNRIADTTEQFVTFMTGLEPYAVGRGFQFGIVTAQAALETNYGKEVIGKNLFSIKATPKWKAAKKRITTVLTAEFDKQGRKTYSHADFRDYDYYRDSIADYMNIIETVHSAGWSKRGNYKEYFRAIAQSGYATDPHYAQKLIDIFEDLGFST